MSKRDLTISFNNKIYNAIYNLQTGLYEAEIDTPETGGYYTLEGSYEDLFGKAYNFNVNIQILAKKPLKFNLNKFFMWIFDYYTFKVKDIVELIDYDITIDEETNAKSFINIIKRTNAKTNDIVAIKRDGKVFYWGLIADIQKIDEANSYQITVNYITNLFNQEIILNPLVETEKIPVNIDNEYNIISQIQTSKYLFFKTTGNIVNLNDKSYFWKFDSVDNENYLIRDLNTNKYLTATSLELNSNFYESDLSDVNLQQLKIEHVRDTKYKLKMGSYYLTIDTETNNLKLYNDLGFDSRQIFLFEKIDESIIKNLGIEDFIWLKINENFIQNIDDFINIKYLTAIVLTHSKKNINVSNVNYNIFNLHTYMTNCTQNYNVIYEFDIKDNSRLEMTIKINDDEKKMIDVNAQNISNYLEVFETDIVSKVVVLTSTETYNLYLLNDRTTTTDMTNENRAEGKTVTVYTENYADARETALNVIRQNSYNHNITFNFYGEIIKVGTPIAIKTKESAIFDTYISSIKIKKNNFIEYTCGNIRIDFISKLKKGL